MLLNAFFKGSNTLNAVHNVLSPIMVIPEKFTYKKIKRVTLAADLETPVSDETIQHIKNWVYSSAATLDIINITGNQDADSGDINASISLQYQLAEFHPVFHFINKSKIENGIHHFTAENQTGSFNSASKKQRLL